MEEDCGSHARVRLPPTTTHFPPPARVVPKQVETTSSSSTASRNQPLTRIRHIPRTPKPLRRRHVRAQIPLADLPIYVVHELHIADANLGTGTRPTALHGGDSAVADAGRRAAQAGDAEVMNVELGGVAGAGLPVVGGALVDADGEGDVGEGEVGEGWMKLVGRWVWFHFFGRGRRGKRTEVGGDWGEREKELVLLVRIWRWGETYSRGRRRRRWAGSLW